MNANHKIKEYIFTPKMMEMTKERYKELCNKLDYEDMRLTGSVTTDESPQMNPMEYSFIMGQISIYELLLMTFEMLTPEESFALKQFKGPVPDEEE